MTHEGEAMREFFGLSSDGVGGFTFLREADGAWSWQHILQVSFFLVLMFALAILFGRRYRDKSPREKNKVLIASAILIDSFELVKIIVLCIRSQTIEKILYVLPLFLCSIQLIAIPMAAFCKGRIKEACLDFVLTFGILGAIFGTVGATQNYGSYPAFSMDNFFSAITHSISGFASLYIAISGMISLKKKNLVITTAILLSFSVMAYVANLLLDYNYMFLMHHDGTPYSIFYNMVGGSPILYPLVVVGIFVIYLFLFYFIYGKIKAKRDGDRDGDSAEQKQTATV